jgi:hypothetical protein
VVSEDWKVIRRCNFLHEAELLRSVLTAADIEARIPDEHTVGVNPGYINMMGGVRLLVRSEDFDRASTILDDTGDRPRPV